MPGIASAVISGIVGIATTLISGSQQEKILESGQEESRALNREQMVESKAARLANEKLAKERLRLEKKQLKESTELNEENLALKRRELGMVMEQNARTDLQNRYARFTSILESNEQLKNLSINRLRGLRN